MRFQIWDREFSGSKEVIVSSQKLSLLEKETPRQYIEVENGGGDAKKWVGLVNRRGSWRGGQGGGSPPITCSLTETLTALILRDE